MRAVTSWVAVVLMAMAWSNGAKAEDSCPASLVGGTFSYSTVHYVILGSGKTAIYVPDATTSVLYFDGVSAMQFQLIDVMNGSSTNTGTYTLSPVLAADGVTTESCLLQVTLSGSTKTQSYYLSLDGTTYYGIDDSQSGYILSVHVLRVSRPS
jgi:hypothetical protein